MTVSSAGLDLVGITVISAALLWHSGFTEVTGIQYWFEIHVYVISYSSIGSIKSSKVLGVFKDLSIIWSSCFKRLFHKKELLNAKIFIHNYYSIENMLDQKCFENFDYMKFDHIFGKDKILFIQEEECIEMEATIHWKYFKW